MTPFLRSISRYSPLDSEHLIAFDSWSSSRCNYWRML